MKTLQWILTFNVVCLAWVFFRAQSIDGAFDVLGQLLTGSGRGYVGILVIVTVVASIASQFVPTAVPEKAEVWFGKLAPVLQIGALAARPRARRRPRPRGHRPVHLLPVLSPSCRRPCPTADSQLPPT